MKRPEDVLFFSGPGSSVASVSRPGVVGSWGVVGVNTSEHSHQLRRNLDLSGRQRGFDETRVEVVKGHLRLPSSRKFEKNGANWKTRKEGELPG